MRKRTVFIAEIYDIKGNKIKTIIGISGRNRRYYEKEFSTLKDALKKGELVLAKDRGGEELAQHFQDADVKVFLEIRDFLSKNTNEKFVVKMFLDQPDNKPICRYCLRHLV